MKTTRIAGHHWYLLGALAVSVLLSGIVYGQDKGSANLAAAKKEGSVVFYSAAPNQVLDKLARGFSSKHPEIKAEYYRSNSAKLFERLQAELRANRMQVDVFHTSDPALFDDLKKDGVLMSYQSPEYRNYPAKYVDKDSTWFVARGHFLIMAYNPGLVPESQAPTSWKDMADPRYRGRVGIMDVRDAGGAYYWQYTVWKLFGPGFFSDMARNQPKTFGGHGPVNDRIISGELALGVNLNYLADRAILDKKAPLRAVYPKEGSPMIQSPVGIVKRARHPNAAKLFIDFLASAEGQAIFNSEYSYSLRKGATLRPGMLPLDKIKIFDLDTADLIAKQEEVQKAIRGAFGVK